MTDYAKLHDQEYPIRLRRGEAADVAVTATLNQTVEGEPLWTTDDGDLYVRHGAGVQYIGGASRFDGDAIPILPVYTDATRPAAGTAGRVIFNSDDGFPNFDDGTNWVDAAGNVT